MAALSSFPAHNLSEEERMGLLFVGVTNMEHPLCDVVLRVKSEASGSLVSIGANSTFLRAKSAVFEKMWQSDSSWKGQRVVDIDDCTEQSIRALNAVAFGQVSAVRITVLNVAELLYAALKYEFQLVIDCCEQYINETVAKEDVNEWMPVIVALYKGKLAEFTSKIVAKCGLFSTKKTIDAFKHYDGIVSVPFALFRDLLKADSLALGEEEIWQTCTKWAERNATRVDAKTDAVVSTLRSLKEYVRFSLMSHAFFITQVGTRGILTEAESWNVVLSAAKKPTIGRLFCCAKPRALPEEVKEDEEEVKEPVEAALKAAKASKSGVLPPPLMSSSRPKPKPKPSLPPPKPSSSSVVFDCFDPRFFEVRMEHSRQILRVTGARRALFGCSRGWSKGVHKWRITVDKCNGRAFGLGVSLDASEYKMPAKKLLDSWNFFDAKTCLFWAKSSCFDFKKSQLMSRGAFDGMKQGDTLHLSVDCENATLTANVGGRGKQFEHALEAGRTYYPVVVSYKNKELIQVTVLFE